MVDPCPKDKISCWKQWRTFGYSEPIDITIFDVLGRLVKNVNGYSCSQKNEVVPIRIPNLTTGVYWVNFRGEGLSKTMQFTCSN